MKWLVVLLMFSLVQVGTTTYVNPDAVIAVEQSDVKVFTGAAIIHLSSGGYIDKVESDWTVQQVIAALKKALRRGE